MAGRWPAIIWVLVSCLQNYATDKLPNHFDQFWTETKWLTKWDISFNFLEINFPVTCNYRQLRTEISIQLICRNIMREYVGILFVIPL